MPIRRHFIDWNQPILPASADYIIERYATSRELDLRNVVLVFTGGRASRRMLELLFEKAAPRWPSFVPPRMTTFRRFPEMLYRQQHRVADDLTQLLIWRKSLTSIPPQELKAALPAIPDDDAVPSWLSLCESLRAQHNELAEDGMEFDEVFAALSRANNHQEADRWKALRRIQSEYLMQMDEFGLWDRQASRLIAVQKNECEVDFDILLIGTVDMNTVVRQMLDQVADRVTAIVHAPESESDSFDEHGCLIPDRWTGRKLDIDVNDTRIADAPSDQAAVVVHEVADFKGARRADEITIGIADESLVPVVLQQFSDAGTAGRWPVEMQLKDTRPWRLLDAVARHLSSGREGEPPDFPTLSNLVRHPDVHNVVDKAVRKTMKAKRPSTIEWLTELDKYTARHLQTSPGVLLGTKRRREIVGAIIKSVDQLLQCLCPHVATEESPKSRRRESPQQKQMLFDEDVEVVSQSTHQQLNSLKPLNVWADGVMRLLASVYRQYELQPEERRDRGLAACCRELNGLVDLLGGVPDAVMPKCSAAQGLQLLLRQIGSTPVPPETDDQAIDLLGWLELAMDDAPVLILSGFNEGFVPESIMSDVFLPNSFRSSLGLRDNNRRYARDAYALTTMMHSREKLVFVSGRRDAKGNPLMPSRLWFAAANDTLADRVQRFYDEEGSGLPVVPADESGSESEEHTSRNIRMSGFVVPRPTLIPSQPAEVSVTAFREYVYCPYRYFLKRELKLRTIEDETLELEAAAFGSLMHDVLKKFGQSDHAHALRAEPIEEFLLKTLNTLAQRRFGKNRSATVAVQLQMMQNRLTAFANWQAATATAGWRIRHTEEDLKYTEFTDAKGRSVILAGRVDRIDQHKDTGHWRVLDYKTSERAEKPETTHFKKNEWVDLQLPLYRLLVRSLGIEKDVRLGYVHLPGDLSSVGESMAMWEQSDLDSAEQTARRVAADIIDLKIDRVAKGHERRFTEFARICQDPIIDRNIPWLEDWNGRVGA